MTLPPLKFTPIVKDKIWGGQKLTQLFGKNRGNLPNIGESWEISGYRDDISVVAEGPLKGTTLAQLIQKHRENLVGKHVFETFGTTFPLLFKVIDANDDLSIQVHPNDAVASQRHNSFGKTEMWYVLDAEPEAELIIGFKEDCTPEIYLGALHNGTVNTLLQPVKVKKGDCIFIPAGLVHAIGSGVVIAEIQQTSDITYRIYDYDRTDDKGNRRKLHTEEALGVISFEATPLPLINYRPQGDGAALLATSNYFTTNILQLEHLIERTYDKIDSFVVYMCAEGEAEIATVEGSTTLKTGESLLIPAAIKAVTLRGAAKVLEVYVP